MGATKEFKGNFNSRPTLLYINFSKLTDFITTNNSIASVAFKANTAHCSCGCGGMYPTFCMINAWR